MAAMAGLTSALPCSFRSFHPVLAPRYGNASSGVFLDRLQTHAVMPLATGVVPDTVAPLTWVRAVYLSAPF